MKLRIILGLVLITAMVPRVMGSEITLTQYLDLVRARHPLFAKEALAVAIQQKESARREARDWELRLAPEYQHLGKVSARGYEGARTLDRWQAQLDLSRRIRASGGSLGLSASSRYLHQHGVPDLLGERKDIRTYTQRLGLRYTQPLLRNLGGSLDRLGVDLQEYSVKVAEVEALENQEALMVQAAAGFLEWAHLSEVEAISRRRLSLAQDQLTRVGRRFQDNLVDRVDLLRAQEAVHRAERELLQAQAEVKAKQAELAVLAQSDLLYLASPVYDLYAFPELPGARQSRRRLKEHSRLLQPLGLLVDQLAHHRRGLGEQKRPLLDLTVEGSLLNSGREFSLKMDRPDWSLALEFALPLGNRRVNAEIEKTDLEIRRLRLERQEREISLQATLEGLWIQLDQLSAILRLNRELIDSARERTMEELNLYRQGRSELTLVLQSQEQEQDARLAYAEQALDFHRRLLELRALLDTFWPPAPERQADPEADRPF